MKSVELRIGNLVLNDNCECTIESLYSARYTSCKLMTRQGNEIIAWMELIEPIPLTEEWLLKFGFTRISEYACNVYRKGNIAIEGGDNYYFRTTKLVCVHQLQNIYFALTNEELTIK